MPSEDISMTLNVLPGTFAGLTAAAAGMNQIVGLVNTLGNRVGKTTTVLDSMLVTLGAGITYASFQAATAAGEFERSMKMVKAVSGQSTAEIDVLSRKANELSISFKMGIEDITEGLQTLGRAGLGSLDTQLSVLETGLSAAKLSGLELNKVLQDIVQTTSLLGGDITSTSFGAQADALTDKILSTSMTAPINMNDIVQTLSYSGGTAAAAGINIQNEDALYDYLGTVSAFARKGVSGSMAGTALRAFFTKPASQDESVKTAFETIGLQAEDLWKNNGQEMRKVSEQIQIIHDAMNKKHMSTLDQIEIWGKIVGNKMGQQMMKLDESNIRQVTQEIKESESSTKLARESMQNFASDLETLNQRAQAMWREFGNSALTVFRPIVSGLKAITALVSSDSIGGTIFGQLMAGGIIVVIMQVIGRLGTAFRLVRSIKDELMRQIRAGGATVQTIEAQRAKQQQVYQAMGLTQQQSDRLSKHAKETGFNIEFAKTALVEFLAQLNKVVVLMHDLVLQTELLGKTPMNTAVSQQYNRFFASGAGTRPLTKVNYGALTPIPGWYGTKEQGGLYAVAEATPYQSDMTSMAYAHGLEQEFLTQLYTGKVSDKYLKKYNLSSSDVFAKWIAKNPSMKYEYTPKGETATGVMIPLSSLGSFLKEKKLGQQYDPAYNGKAALMEQIGGGTSGVVNINNPKTVTWTGDTSQNTPYYGKYAEQMQNRISTSIKKETDAPQFKTFQDKINNKLYGYPFAGAAQTPFLSPDKTTQSAITNALQKTDEAAIKEMEALIAKEMQNENANIDKLLKELEVMESQFKTQQKTGPKTLNQSRDAFVQKYGMTPEQYDKNIKQVRSLADLQEIEKQNQLYKNSLTNMIRTKGGHARWAATYAQDLTDVQNQIRTKKEYGSAFYAESQSKNERIATTLGIKGLKGWSDTYIKDMKRLEQVSKQVSQAKGLQFTKAGYITKDTATTQYAKDYNELRKLYSGKGGPLDKNMEAKDIQKVAASQNALIKENSNLVAQYKVNEEYMKAFDAELKALTIKEKELNSKLTQQINEIATLDAEIKNTSNALKEFAAILSNPQNQKVLQNRKDEGIVRTHHDELNRLNSEQIKKDREAISKTAQTNATSGIASAYKDYAKQYTKEKEAELDKLNSARAQNALTGNKVFGPQAPNAYQKQLSNIAKQEEENLKLREKYMPQYGYLAGRGAGTTANPDEWDKYTTKIALKKSNINADGNRVFNQGGFLSRLRASWNQETSKTSRYYGDAMRNTGFGSSLRGALSKHILNPIANTGFGRGLRDGFLSRMNPDKFARERQNALINNSQNIPSKYAPQMGIPTQFLSRGYMGMGGIKADTTGLKQWATQGGMLRFFNYAGLKESFAKAGSQWSMGGKGAAVGTALGGALGSVSMLFGPIEALTMAISIGNMLYQKGLQNYNDKLTKLESSLSNAIDRYEKAQDSFTKSYSKNKDEIIQSEEKIQSSWDKYQKGRNIGTRTDINAKAAAGTQFVGGSRKVENALITIAQARETGSIKNLDSTTLKMHEELVKVRSSVDELAEHQTDALYGSTGYFTNMWDAWDLFWNPNDLNDDMTVLKHSAEKMSGASQMLVSSIQASGETSWQTEAGGLVENSLKSEDLYGRGMEETFLEHTSAQIKGMLGFSGLSVLNPYMPNLEDMNESWGERVRRELQDFKGMGPDFSSGAYKALVQDISRYDSKTQNKMLIALNKNEKDFKYLGKLLLHENANSGRIRNYLTGLGLKTGLNSIQVKQAAIMQAVYDMKEIAQNSVLPQIQDIMMSGYQTAMAGDATAGYSAGSVQAEQAIYSAASVIATNTAILADNYITEQAEKDAEKAMGPLGGLLNYGWVSGQSGAGQDWFAKAIGVDTAEIRKIEEARLESLWLAGHPGRTQQDAKDAVAEMRKNMEAGKNEAGVKITNWGDQNKYIEETELKGVKWSAQKQILDQWENSSVGDEDGGSGKGSGDGSDKDKNASSRKNWVNLAICNKKEIPKLNVNLFKKPPNFTILNRNFKLRDVNVNTADDAKSIQNAVKNSIIEIQNRSNPKIIQDDAAEYDPVNATPGNEIPTGTKKTE